MSNPFDQAYDSVLRREEEGQSHAARMQEQASQQQRHARQIAEPYLLSVAPAVLQKLTSLGIEPINRYVGPAPAGSIGPRPTRSKRPYWPLDATYFPDGKIQSLGENMLCITDEGYFVRNTLLAGVEGFDDLLSSLYVIGQGPLYSDVRRDSPVCVEEGTDRVCTARTDWDRANVSEFSDHIAEHVRLLHRASQHGALWTH